jgi:hypothetical protein
MQSSTFDGSRDYFNKVLDAYLSYVVLYKLCNRGSIEGVTPFEAFYWRFTYGNRYEDPDRIAAESY